MITVDKKNSSKSPEKDNATLAIFSFFCFGLFLLTKVTVQTAIAFHQGSNGATDSSVVDVVPCDHIPAPRHAEG